VSLKRGPLIRLEIYWVKHLLKFFNQSVAISATSMLFLAFLPNVGMTQNSPECFLVNSSGQVVDLDNLCQEGQQVLQKASACQGPFDSDGFPIAFDKELERLEASVTAAKQRNATNGSAPEVMSALMELLNQMPFSARTKELLKEQTSLLKQMRTAKTPEEAQKPTQQFRDNSVELAVANCKQEGLKLQTRRCMKPH